MESETKPGRWTLESVNERDSQGKGMRPVGVSVESLEVPGARFRKEYRWKFPGRVEIEAGELAGLISGFRQAGMQRIPLSLLRQAQKLTRNTGRNGVY
ncbi:hypothetical protein [Corynebacterium urogenitale]